MTKIFELFMTPQVFYVYSFILLTFIGTHSYIWHNYSWPPKYFLKIKLNMNKFHGAKNQTLIHIFLITSALNWRLNQVGNLFKHHLFPTAQPWSTHHLFPCSSFPRYNRVWKQYCHGSEWCPCLLLCQLKNKHLFTFVPTTGPLDRRLHGVGMSKPNTYSDLKCDGKEGRKQKYPTDRHTDRLPFSKG